MSSLPDTTTWAVNEFADAELGDLRRTKRLVELATVLAQNPRASLPEARSNSAMLKAAYRFFEIEATYGRLAHVPVVLAVHDTTEVHWTSLRATTGLGPLGHTAGQGLFVQSTVAITPERVPLGLLAHQVWERDPHEVGKRARRTQRPMTQKERQKWLWSLEAVVNAHDEGLQTRLVSVGDREADIDDVLAAERPGGRRAVDARRVGALCQRA